jgi:hypothetical protein
MCCAIDKDESVAITTNGEAVAKCDVHVDRIEVEVSGLVKRLTTFSFGDCRECPKRGELATIYPFTIAADLKDVLVILEFAAAHDVMKLL